MPPLPLHQPFTFAATSAPGPGTMTGTGKQPVPRANNAPTTSRAHLDDENVPTEL